MSEIELSALLADASQAGAYFVDVRDREALVEAAITLKFAVLPVDLRGCIDADAAMAVIADVLHFPEWFGETLDALADCLSDLSWLPASGYVLLLENTGEWRAQASDTFDAMLEILNQTAECWAKDRVPFWAFLPVSTRVLAAIK